MGADEGTFTAIKIKVLRRPVHFKDVKVHFADGEVQDVELRRVVKAGGATRAVDLEGGRRVITRVELWYEAETARRGKRSKVELLGRR